MPQFIMFIGPETAKDLGRPLLHSKALDSLHPLAYCAFHISALLFRHSGVKQ